MKGFNNDAKALAKAIRQTIKKQPTKWEPVRDLLDHAIHHTRENRDARLIAQEVRNLCTARIHKKGATITQTAKYHELLGECLLFQSHYDVDAYLIRLEWNREPEKRFYQPRRDKLQPMVAGLQDLFDDKLDILSISCPPGVGKSQ